jgi:hypothetical protein
MAGPSPVPPVVRAVSARVNRSKACGRKFNAWAVVADSDVDSPVVTAAGSDGDWWGFVFDGVVDEVADDPVEVVRVDADVLAGWAFDTDFVAESVAVASGDGVSR